MKIVRSQRVFTPEGIRPAAILIKDGVIEAIAGHDTLTPGAVLLDYGDSLVMPGVVDTHVHINEPGRTEWEGFQSATESAAAGGITSLVDMPLNSVPVTTSWLAFKEKRAAAQGKLRVDVGFWGGVVPGNAGELAAMVEAGILGFKCFLIDSGIAEFGWVGEEELRPAMLELKRLGVPLLAHAEVAGPMPKEPQGDPRSYASYLASRPRASENEAVALLGKLCRETGARTHVVHHSSSDALQTLREAKADGVPLSAETCPHYLRFAAEDIPDGATEFKCAPPIRERENREALWLALGDGTLDFIASDHSPCTPQLKAQEAGRFDEAWGGVSGLQLALPVVWTEAQRRGFTLQHLVRWLCEGPARLAGLGQRKGRLAPGFDADLCVWRPDEGFKVDANKLSHKHKLTPYAGAELQGLVLATLLRGDVVFDRGDFPGPLSGQELLR